MARKKPQNTPTKGPAWKQLLQGVDDSQSGGSSGYTAEDANRDTSSSVKVFILFANI
jgi:hypothetical protein